MNEKDLQSEETQEFRKIPLSHVVHVDIDDEVSSIFDRVKSKKTDLVYLVVPHRAVLFQSIVNVKILKRKAKDHGKEIAFITKDKSGVFFANKCNIPVYDGVGQNKKEIDSNDIPENILTEADRNKPAFSTARPTKTTNPKTKTSIAELIRKLNLVTVKEKIQKFLFKFSRKQGRKNYAKQLLMSNPNRKLLLILIAGSIGLLFLVAYIALPSATILVKPNAVPIEQAVNITLADAGKNAGLLKTRPNRVIASYEVNPGIIEINTTFNATGNDLTGSNAHGTVTIYNNSNNEFPLKPFTRLQTDSGVVFRTQHFTTVKAGTGQNPSQVQVEVIADAVDINNVPAGEKGNLEPNTKLFIPGLKTVTKDQVYATNADKFEGGISSKDKIVTTRDIAAAKEFANAEIIKAVPQKLQEYLLKMNSERNLNLTLLNEKEVTKIGNPQVFVDASIIGQKMNSFNVTVRVDAIGLAYDQNEFTEILKAEITLRKSPDKSLTQVDEKGITYRIFKINEELGVVEMTATIRGVERFDLDESKETAQRLIQKIKSHVAGLEIAEAKKYVENLPEIESAVINTWPFWAPTIPGRADSIKIQIQDAKN